MKKIMVIGCPGSGKSTFSRRLHAITGLPLYHLDMMYWNTDRTTVEKSVFRARLTEAIRKDEWIIDGNYNSTLELRMQACDRAGKPRSDMPWIETEEDAEFIGFIKSYNSDSRPNVMELLEKYCHKKIYIFRSRDEANGFLAGMQ